MARREATQTQTQLGGVGGDAVQGGEANNNALTEEPIPVDEEVKELQEGDVVAVFGEIVEVRRSLNISEIFISKKISQF